MANNASSTTAGHSGGTPFRVYKPGQGNYVRWGTAAGAGVIAVAGAMFVRDQLPAFVGDNQLALTLIPVGVILILGYLIWWLVGRHEGVVNFMIATEGEMKKVNWSSRREVWGATKVVIVTVFALAGVLFVVDIFFMLVFSSIGVLKIPILQNMFGTAGAQ